MADKSQKIPGSAAGKYYVDTSCIHTMACCLSADKNFKTSPGGDACLVYKQPTDAKEEKACKEAMQACPTSSIGDDGA